MVVFISFFGDDGASRNFVSLAEEFRLACSSSCIMGFMYYAQDLAAFLKFRKTSLEVVEEVSRLRV